VRKVSICIFLVAFCTFFAACGLRPGIVDNVRIKISDSDRFTQDEIESAMEVVKERFVNNFRGCELFDLWYCEDEFSRLIDDQWVESRDFELDNAIVLRANFYVSYRAGSASGPLPGGGSGVFTDWRWLLVRDSLTDSWVVVDGGRI